MNHLTRANAVKIAAILSLLLGIASFVMAIPFLNRGEANLDVAGDAPPFFIIMAGFVFAILRIIGAYGAWKNQRWGIILTILANAIDGVLALPGILFAPTTELWISSIVDVLASIVIIVLCLWRDRRAVMA